MSEAVNSVSPSFPLGSLMEPLRNISLMTIRLEAVVLSSTTSWASETMLDSRRVIKFLFITLLLSSIVSLAQEVVELKTTASNLIVIKLMFRNGSISDPKGKEGLTELTASLITEGGTKDLTSTQIKDKVYPWAAEFGSSVDKEVSVFTFIVHKDFLTPFYEIVTVVMLTPSFTEEDFKRVKSNKQNYVDQVIRSSSDEEYSKKALEDFLFKGTNYQHMVEGTSEGVKNITLDDVKNHYKNYFTRGNVMIGIAGNYTPEFLNTLKAAA